MSTPSETAGERAERIRREGYPELAAEAGRERYSPREQKAIAFYEWAMALLARKPWLKFVIGIPIAALALLFTVGALILPFFGIDEDTLGEFGYFGIFAANFLGTSTVFIPVPGLTAAAQALIVDEASERNFILVGLVGGLGMGLGEATAYLVGLGGGRVARGRELGGPEWFKTAAQRITRWVNALMSRHGTATLFTLSAIPNPAFEFAGITAGAIQFDFRRFMVAVTLGKIVRGLILAAIGYYSIDFLGL